MVGASLFIPVFFIDLGLMLDLPVFARTMVGSPFALLLIATLIGTKGLAALWAGRFYGYGRAQILTMWSLSLPQVAATLAATFVGFRGGLLDSQVLNGVLALMVVTASLGPWLTARAIPLLPRLLSGPEPNGQAPLERRGLAVLVPITNPAWERGLIELAGLLANGKGAVPGRLMPLKVVTPEQSGAGRQWLQRSGSDIAGGIAAAALEQDADLVVMGLEPAAGLGRWLFGDLVEATCRQVACPVVVARLHGDPASLQRLLVPIKHLTAAALEQFQLARRLAAACGARLTLLHLHDPNLPAAALGQLGEELQAWLGGAGPEPGPEPVPVQVEVMLKPSWAVENDLIAASSHHDLVILRCQRHVVAGLPIPASERVSRLLGRLECSTLVISDPLRS